MKIKDPPEIIYAIGNLKLLQNPKVAIIGSRKHTEYGKTMALNFAKKLSEKGYTIVSGLAKGIDSYAHIGAMLGKAKTIIVLPCGFKQIYPKVNQSLYQEIVENGGLAICEYRDEIKADKEKLVARNRIVAGISNGVLVIEGDYRTGTTITVGHANKKGVPVFCIPGNLDNGKSYTPNLLIKQGNFLVTNEQDIIDIIENKSHRSTQREKKMLFETNIERQYNMVYKTDKKQNKKLPYQIYTYINERPINIDTLIEKSKLAVNQINYELTMLIVEGYIQELPGRYYVRI